MHIVIGLFLGACAALFTPLLFKGTSSGMAGLLGGGHLHIPYLEMTVAWSWFSFIGTFLLVAGLLRFARSS